MKDAKTLLKDGELKLFVVDLVWRQDSQQISDITPNFILYQYLLDSFTQKTLCSNY